MNQNSLSQIQIHGEKLLDCLPEALVIADACGHIIIINSAAKQLFCKTDVELPPDLNIINFFQIFQIYLAGTDQLYPKDRSPFTKALAGESAIRYDLEIHREDCVLALALSAVSVSDAQGGQLFTVATIHALNRNEGIEGQKFQVQGGEPDAPLYAEIRSDQERLQALSRKLIEIQETERRALAHELHDEVGQALTAIKINLQAAGLATEPVAVASRIQESIAIVERALEQVRNLSLNLRPSMLDDLGLVPALRWFVNRQTDRTGIDMRFTAPPSFRRLLPEKETACYRIVQEALTNVVRHAHATFVTIELFYDADFVRLVITDNGCGFDLSIALECAHQGMSLGLLGMEERARFAGGSLEILPEPGKGTVIRAVLPHPH